MVEVSQHRSLAPLWRWSLLCLALVPSGCLPADTRPEPGSLLSTVEGSESTLQGWTTDDGWDVVFDRVLLTIGPMQFGDACDKYSEAGYDRILDVTRHGRQKLSVLFGLGRCDVDFEASPPGLRSVLGEGVSESDRDTLRLPARDALGSAQGSVLRVEGSAARQGRVLAFAWDLRQRLYFTRCQVQVAGEVRRGIALRSAEALTQNLLIEVESLFCDDAEDRSSTRFQPFADADAVLGDADGLITLAELGAQPLEAIRGPGRYSGRGLAATVPSTLGEYLHLALWPELIRYRDTGSCEVSLEED